jgi:hypothetical protein
LEAIAYLTANGQFTTNREIRRRTNLSSELISNVCHDDVKRAILERRGDKIRMTSIGYQFLREMGSSAGNPLDPLAAANELLA